MPARAWGFKSPLRHFFTGFRPNAKLGLAISCSSKWLNLMREGTDHQGRGSLSRAKKVVVALNIATVCSSSTFLHLASRIKVACSVVTPLSWPVATRLWGTHLLSVSAPVLRRAANVVIAAYSDK